MKPYSANHEKSVKDSSEWKKIFASLGIGVFSLIIIALVSVPFNTPTKKKLESSNTLTELILLEEKEMPIQKLYFLLKNSIGIAQDARSEELKIIHDYTHKLEDAKKRQLHNLPQLEYIQYLHLLSLHVLLELKKTRSPLLTIYINQLEFPVNNHIPGISAISVSASAKHMTDFQLEALLLTIEERLEQLKKN
jgi:hypothetical protein